MIVDALLSGLLALLRLLTALLPNPAAPDLHSLVVGLRPLWAGLGWVDYYAPISEAVYCLTTIATFAVGFFVFKLGMWVMTKAHILGGNS